MELRLLYDTVYSTDVTRKRIVQSLGDRRDSLALLLNL